MLVVGTSASALAPRRAGRPPRPIGRALARGDLVPPIAGATLEGREVTVAYDRFKLTLVNFWATWCVPCRSEMPALERIRAAHPGDEFQLAGVIIHDPASSEEHRAAVTAAGVTYTILVGKPDTDLAWGGLDLLPTTFLVDSQGKLVRKFVGTDDAQLAALAKDVDDFLAGRALGNPYLPPSAPEPSPAVGASP